MQPHLPGINELNHNHELETCIYRSIFYKSPIHLFAPVLTFTLEHLWHSFHKRFLLAKGITFVLIKKKHFFHHNSRPSDIMTSWHENAFRVTGPLWGESIVDRWIPFTKGQKRGFWYFLWCQLKQTAEQTRRLPVIWDTMTPVWVVRNKCGRNYAWINLLLLVW